MSHWFKIDILSAEYRLPLLATTGPPCSVVSLRLRSLCDSWATCNRLCWNMFVLGAVYLFC